MHSIDGKDETVLYTIIHSAFGGSIPTKRSSSSIAQPADCIFLDSRTRII